MKWKMRILLRRFAVWLLLKTHRPGELPQLLRDCCKIRLWVMIDQYNYCFTTTYASPTSVPRASRIPGATMFPLIEGTQFNHRPYSGYSYEDRKAIESSRNDLLK